MLLLLRVVTKHFSLERLQDIVFILFFQCLFSPFIVILTGTLQLAVHLQTTTGSKSIIAHADQVTSDL